ncbi:MAG: hypothetical protein ISN28_13425 [Ectothiorhodospiraceae bacterium AqS1]|nr:hypothetical protein [Ectothiorhodospiraceae bacterium AqS1]
MDVTDTTLVLILDPTSVSVTEGSTATFDVKLERDPGKAVTVTLTKTAASSSDITLSPSTLNFTTSNWSADQSVTVTAATDTDSDDDMATVNLTASDGDSQVTHSLNIRAKDNTPKMVVSSSSLALDEEGTAGTVNVKLKAVQPAANQDVTVNVTSSYTGVTVSPSTLTFTNSNWETNQALTITAVADDNSIDEEVTITLDASGGAYDVARVDEEVEVDVSDNDTPDLTLSKSALTIVEGASDTIQAKLATEPSGNVTVSVASSNTEVSLDTDTSRTGRQDTLTFTKDNWSTNQNVHVATAHDDEATDDPATITFSFAGAEYDELDDIRISVTVDDDDMAGLTISALDAVIEGESKTFTVELSSDPLSQVNVDLAQTGTANADVSFSPDELIFTSGDWDTKQRVTVFAAEDDDSSQDRATIKLTASGGGSGANSYASITKDVTVRVTDDDTPGLRLSSEIVEVLEGTALGNTLKVRLLTQPTSNVTLNFVLTGSPDVKLDTDPNASGAQSTLIFTNSNWRTDRSVKITADTDEDSDSDTANIRISASGAEYAAVSEDVKVNVKDSTVDLKFVPENGSVSVDEGSFSTFTAVLSVQPEENVAVDLEQREPARSDVRFFPTNLIFTPSRWDTPQTITVYADEDDNASGHYAFIDLETSGGGADYRNVTRTVTVMVQDPDVAALILEPTSLTVLEGIGTTFTVKLATDPIEDVEVAVIVPSDATNTNDVRVYTGPQKNEKLVFTSENWDEPQTVTVTTVRDDDTDDAAVHITLKSTGGGDGSDDYDLDEVKIGMNVVDIDKPGLSLSHSSLEVDEGLDATFTVRLITKPSDEVTVKIDPLTNPDVTLDADPDTLGNQSNKLTFTKTNWDTPQPVILSAARDLNANDETLTISMTASKGGYDHVEVDGKMVPVEASLRVKVKDKDEEGSLLSSFGTAAADAAGTITMTEGNETGFEVALHVPPTENVTVVLTSDNSDISFDPDRIVFTPSGSTSSPMSDSTPTAGAGRAATMTSVWNVPVRVKLTVAQDDDAFLETARIFMTASGGNYVDARVVRHLNIKDDDRVDPGPGLARPGDPLTWPVKSYAFAIPPASNGDQAAVRLQCKEPSENCTAFFDCTAQTDSRTYRGLWPRSIPPRGADVVALSDIAEVVDDSPQRQGRLACVIRSQQNIVAQVWTRSGDGVLVNNSQLIHSDSNHEADIGTIPSLGTGDRSNIRIRCNKVGVDDCTGTRLECAEDDGTVHIAHIGAILRGIVRHVQTEELSDMLDHEWDGLSLSCSVFSDQAFTVQILTRTGGGGALVNNSAVSAR